LGLPADLGALEVGRLADFFLFDPYRLKTVPMHEPLSTLVYTGEQSNVDTVVIDGKVVLEGCRFTTVDEDAFVREVHERALALSKRVGTFRLLQGRRFTPFDYDRIHSRAPSRQPSADPGRRPDVEAESDAVAAGDGSAHVTEA